MLDRDENRPGLPDADRHTAPADGARLPRLDYSGALFLPMPTRVSSHVRAASQRWLRGLAALTFAPVTLSLLALCIYLFVSAPAPLHGEQAATIGVPVAQALGLVARENAAIRALYTEQIVASGKRVGLLFDEDWRKPSVEAGPLPALFLRMMAEQLQQRGVPLGLFLGSEYPIAPENRFDRAQRSAFQALLRKRTPQVVFLPEIRRYVAMFPDVASSDACVDCHNEHPRSAKHDWKLGDVMGATTWMYPSSELTLDQTLLLVRQLREAASASYAAYLEKVRTFSSPPEVGKLWPKEGRFLPDVPTFMQAVEQKIGPETLRGILAVSSGHGA